MTDQSNEYQPRLFGPGRKYKSLEALETSRERADEYITILERQLDEYREDNVKLREENTSKANLEDLYDRVVSARNRPLDQPYRREATETQDIEKIVESKIAAAQKAMEYRSNLNKVKETLEEKLGKDYKESLKKRIEALDLTEEEADSFAQTKPKTFLKMLGLDKPEPFQAPPSNTNISSTKNAEQKRTWAYYQQMKKDNPSQYYAPKTNLQMLEDYRQLGKDFEDGDFARFGDSISNY